jgi:hypothetical protein
MVLETLEAYGLEPAAELEMLHRCVDFLTCFWLESEGSLPPKTEEEIRELARQMKADDRLCELAAEMMALEEDLPGAVAVAKAALAEKLRQTPGTTNHVQ